jgi:hypothetical protein
MMIDHITLAVPDLEEAASHLKMAGLEVTYGGVHSTGKTHMSLCALGDGSYLEVVAPFGAAQAVPLWHDRELPSHGGAAWTIAVDDVGTEIARARHVGVEGRGPVQIRRKKPDGVEGRWELGYLGVGQPGATLPFLIRDFTDRSVRVTPDPRFAAAWAFVVLAVFDIQKTAELFQTLYGCSAHATGDGGVALQGLPVHLTSPAVFLDKFGEAPCGAVLRLRDPASRVEWFDLPWAHFQLGIER